MTKQEIEQLKSSLRIEEVIGKTVKLERKGANYIGLCPFHNDHHPSFLVNPEKQTFHCFACGEHGDTIGFIEKMEHCGFMEAVGKMTANSGQSTGRRKRETDSDAKHLSTEKNSQFLSSFLPYACGNSELTPAYLDFEVGQSPVNVPKKWYAMRNRIVFPIRDEAGQLVAFAARRLADGNPDEPKYINSSAADGYKKGETLYALYLAKESIERQGFVFIVEGYKDAIAMHAAGFTNTVALCGTALTAGQLLLLQKYTKRICLLLDGDMPGRNAARKIAMSLDPDSIELQMLPLPEGEDPDSLFRRLGKEAFVSLIDRYRSKPHLSEELLLTACLLFQDTFYMFKGSLCLFTELLNNILKTDNLLPENKKNQMILAHLAEGYLESELPPALKGIADELRTEYDTLIYREIRQFEFLYPNATNVMDMYLTRLFFLYTENRILRDIQKQVRLLLATTPEKKKKRLAILVHIAERREQLRHVSENLDRPGAVWY